MSSFPSWCLCGSWGHVLYINTIIAPRRKKRAGPRRCAFLFKNRPTKSKITTPTTTRTGAWRSNSSTTATITQVAQNRWPGITTYSQRKYFKTRKVPKPTYKSRWDQRTLVPNPRVNKGRLSSITESVSPSGGH